MSNFFNKTKIQASEIYSQIYDYVTDQFQQVGKIFSISSAYGQILSVISKISSMMFYFIEDSVTEQNILTASRTQSIQGLARLTGHDATRAISATGEIKFSVKTIPQIQDQQVIIFNNTKILCLNNNRVYTLSLTEEQLRLNIHSTQTYYSTVIQGEIQIQTFTGNGTPLQSYSAVTKGSVLVDNFFVNVYVNGQKWQKYDSLYDIPRGGLGYLVKTGISGGIDVYFGTENFGAIPDLGSTIRIEYLLSGGEAGNLREDDSVQFQWLDTGYSLTGEEVDLNSFLQTNMSKLITFGSNPEPTSLTRLLAPHQSRSFVLANPTNYIIFFQKFNYFSTIDAFTTYDDQYLDDDNVIYLFLIPDIKKRIQSNENYFTVNEKYFTLTDQEKNKAVDLIEDSGSKIATSITKIINPTLTRYVVNITLIVFEGYSQDAIKNVIIAQLSDYFLSVKRRDIIPSSDLVKIIENVEGVDAVNVNFLSQNNEISKLANPLNPTIGIDNLGDIIISKNELPIIRGGWKDRHGIYYENGIYSDRPCSVNISIKAVSPMNVNTRLLQNSMNNIMNN